MEKVKTVSICILFAALLSLSVFYVNDVGHLKGVSNFYESQLKMQEELSLRYISTNLDLEMELKKCKDK